MLSNKQSLLLTGLMVAGLFVFGVLDILDNFLVLTILTLVFFAIVINIFYSSYKFNQENNSNFSKQQHQENK